jgi:hypothetical protein
VAIYYLTIASNQTWNFKTELANRGTHAIHGCVVLARVARVFYKPFDRPKLGVLCDSAVSLMILHFAHLIAGANFSRQQKSCPPPS